MEEQSESVGTKDVAPGKGPVYVVDGSGYIFRAFYAVQSLTNSKGFPTNALFGFVRMLLKLLKDADSEYVVMVFDAGRQTFRNKLYPAYKQNRDECPTDLVAQMPLFREFARAFGLTLLEMPGYEADDLIATLTERLRECRVPTVIVSGDKDLLQLVSDDVEVWDTMKDRRYRRAEVIEKFGVPPEQVVDFLGLMGDSSDNVPGLSGVGPKTAAQLITKYGKIESIISRVAEISTDKTVRARAAIAQQIEENPDLLRLSRQLVEVLRSVPLAIGNEGLMVQELPEQELLGALRRRSPDKGHLRALIEQCEFTSMLRDIDLVDAPGGDELVKAAFLPVLADQFDDFVAALRSKKEFAFDTETTSLNVLEARLVGASFCWDDDTAYYIPLAHDGIAGQVPIDEFVQRVGPLLADPSVKKCGQNLKYDTEVLAGLGISVRGVGFDSMLAAYVLAPDKGSYDLTTLARDYLGLPTIEFTDVVTEGATFASVGLTEAARYAGQDALYVWRLRSVLGPEIEKAGLAEVLYGIEAPLVTILASMERCGIAVDTELLKGMALELESEIARTQSQLFALCGCEFNLNSPKQLAELLFVKLGISTKGLKRTKTGTSTDSGVLEKIRSLHPAPDLILRHRFLHKLKNTYVDALLAECSPLSGRIHTKFNQTGTATGRLSSSDPNLQNIPIQTAEGRRIRRAFIAPEGKVLLSADYSQIELRVLAHLSGDELMCEAFRTNVDIHAATTREILGIPSGQSVDGESRRIGKTINFGIVYGMSGFRLAGDLGIDVGTANIYIQQYFERYKGVRRYLDSLEHEARTRGYVTTMYGRKRIIADIDTSERGSGFLNRVAMNAPIQGSAADLMKLAMIKVASLLPQFAETRLLLQIHDELLFEVPEGQLATVQAAVIEAMESVASLKVPLRVEVGAGKNWEEAHA